MSEDEFKPVPIDIVGDIVCADSYLGKRLVDAVIQSIPGVEVEVRWYPYQLDPDLPKEGMDRTAYLEQRFGAGKVEEALAKHSAAAQEFGLEFGFDKIARQPNTFDAHRLIRYAYGFGVQAQVVERLFQAFFFQGLDIGNHEVLAAIAAKARLDPNAVLAFLAGSEDIASLQQEIAAIRASGVSEIPRFTFGGKQDIVGLQSADVFADALFNCFEEG
jgi:predicted DsbA family dithiol-disulfide isomerase